MKRSWWILVAWALLVGPAGCGGDGQPEQGSLALTEVGSQTAESAGAGPAQSESRPPRKIEKVRQAAVAGLFYPRDKDELAGTLDELLKAAEKKPVGRLRGLVSPHAGYEFSGPVAATGYKLLEGRQIDTVIVMAPSHYARFEGASIPDVDAYETPLGMAVLSPEAAELAKVEPFCVNPSCDVRRPDWWRRAPKEVPPFGQDTPHTWEHSLEVQLPFLQRTLGEFELVPVVFGEVDAAAVAKALVPRLDDRTLLVASSDLSHYHPYEVAVRLDDGCVKAICNLDAEAVAGAEACGKGPVEALIHVAKKKGWKARLLDCRNSGDTSGNRGQVVGYAAIAFYEPDGEPPAEPQEPELREPPTPPPKAQRFSSEERAFLLDLARRTVEAAAAGDPLPEPELADVPSAAKAELACFVTLTKQGELRGCIGSLVPRQALYRDVIDRARAATVEDHRFTPVRPDELDEIEVEVSVLTVPERLDYTGADDLLAKLRPGVDGVVLQVGRGQATFLPQVWEQLPDKETFLSRLSMKAGLPAYAWRSPGALVLTYHVEAFHESETPAGVPAH
jgi:AmmeMemoRadiSam system protein B/AmmeMemoRadiSam system protein A